MSIMGFEDSGIIPEKKRPNNTNSELDDMLMEVRHGLMSNTKAMSIIKAAIEKEKLEARIDELTWYLGYNHKAMSEQVWKKTSERIAELKAQLKKENTHDSKRS